MKRENNTRLILETLLILIMLLLIQYIVSEYFETFRNHIITVIAIVLTVIFHQTRSRYYLLLEENECNIQDSIRDKLTGLYNRNYLDEFIKTEFGLSDRQGSSLSIIYFDIDKFKHINDTYGHEIGDVILKKVSDIVVENTRVSDMACRWGGDEYILILPNTDEPEAVFVAEKIRVSIEDYTFSNDINITVSLGIAERVEGEYYSSLFRRVDKALYYSKENGRNRVSTYKYNEDEVDIKFSWLESWNFGNQVIDSQHRRLVELTNQLSETFSVENGVTDEIIEISNNLVEDVRSHFRSEIIELQNANYPFWEGHEKVHDELLATIENKKQLFLRGELPIRNYLTFMFNELVINHLIHEDSKYKDYI